ncbi:MAG: hypothetical protein EXS68_01125 [Candidatus Ryanbacteria bacterium]|nr:hypothetical protein [Candidatus Ryanbacteria bacterium]
MKVLATLITLVALLLPRIASAEVTETRAPNIVVFVLDDASTTIMTQTMSQIAAQGMQFSATIPAPICAASRAAMLTGMHSHNSLIGGNGGQYRDVWLNAHEGNTLGNWLQSAGYRTILSGKYLNFLHDIRYSGWDVQIPIEGRGDPHADVYWVDLLRDHTLQEISATPSDTPIALWFAPASPHGPLLADRKYQGTSWGIPFAPSPNFNEADVSDKFSPAGELPLFDWGVFVSILDRYYDRRDMMRSLVDAFNAIQSAMADRETYFFIISDNGYFEMGEHRFARGKGWFYEESSQVPLIIIGDGIAPAKSPALVYNLDITATIADLAGLTTPTLDGISLVPFLLDPNHAGRKRVLLGYEQRYSGVRTAVRKLVRLGNGHLELYHLRNDPYELSNRCLTTKTCERALEQHIEALKTCAGSTCLEREMQ